MRTGVFGGTFDPVHNGHVIVAAEARAQLQLDELLVVPAGDPWQKRGRVHAGAVDRLAMVRAAFDGVAGVTVSAIETERAGPTFTADTLLSLTDERRDRALFLVIGADAVRRIDTWDRVDVIRSLATLAVVARAGDDALEPPGGGWRVERVAIPRLDISSTDLRDRLACGAPVDGLMPSGAIRVVRERRLYTRS